MLSDREKEGAKDLLKLMSVDDCLSLSKTVTDRKVCSTTKSEAFQAIVNYSQSAAELLRRRKVSCQALLTYLGSKQCFVDPKSEKRSLCQSVLQLWGSAPMSAAELMEVQNEDYLPRHAPALLSQAAVAVRQAQHIPELSQPKCPSPSPVSSEEDDEFATTFICWFYPLLNGCHSVGAGHHTDNFDQTHFFDMCSLKVAQGAVVDGNVQFEEHQGSAQVAKRLREMVMSHSLQFCPNIDKGKGGYRGQCNPAGQRLVMVCGTLHAQGNIVGVFEQQFGLVRDPDADFNFRIKFTKIKLMAGHPNQQPTLALTEKLMVNTGTV